MRIDIYFLVLIDVKKGHGQHFACLLPKNITFDSFISISIFTSRARFGGSDFRGWRGVEVIIHKWVPVSIQWNTSFDFILIAITGNSFIKITIDNYAKSFSTNFVPIYGIEMVLSLATHVSIERDRVFNLSSVNLTLNAFKNISMYCRLASIYSPYLILVCCI